jgi:hypothetical protein
VRPELRRRPRSLEELAGIMNVPFYVVSERVERLPSRQAVRCGPDTWRLSDPGWEALLGRDFAAVLAAGGVRAHRAQVAAAGERDAAAVVEPVERRPDRSERARLYAPGRVSLRRVAGFWGEDVELEVLS